MYKRVWRLIHVHWKRLLTLRGDRRVIARGIALGIAMNFIPTLGLGPPLVYWVAGIIKGHRVSALVTTMGVKALFPLFYVLNYITGEFFLEQRFAPILSWNGVMDFGVNFLLGVVINFMIAFIITYNLSLHWIQKRRDKTLTRRHFRHDLLSRRNN